MKKIVVIDTNIFCVFLEIPGKDVCGSNGDIWNKARVDLELQKFNNHLLVLPLAAIIETGNHISQAPGDRKNLADKLVDIIEKSLDMVSPWAAFSEQAKLWSPESLSVLVKKWPSLAAQKFSMGDATIKDVADHYADAGFEVEIMTADAQLKAYEPPIPEIVPRRKRRRS